MKQIIFFLISIIFSLSLYAEDRVLVDLIHGVDYTTSSETDCCPIDFEYLLQGYEISYMTKNDIALDNTLVDETISGGQNITYNFNLPEQSEFESVKTIYIFVTPEITYPMPSTSGVLYNPQNEIVSAMFNKMIHYDNASGAGWRLMLNLSEENNYHIVIGYGNVLLGSESTPGHFYLTDYDCAIRVIDETYIAFNGVPEEYSEQELTSFSEGFADSLGFLNVYNYQDVYYLKPFVHFDTKKNIPVDFEVYFNGTKTLAEPVPKIEKGHLSWQNIPLNSEKTNEIIYEAAIDSRMNFIHFTINENQIVLENQIPYELDHVFIFRYSDKNRYLLAETKILKAYEQQKFSDFRELSTHEILDYVKSSFYQTAVSNGLKPEEADHLVNDFIWIETLLKRAKDYPADYFGFYHFSGELYDKLIPYRCSPEPEEVQRNAWVMLSNIINRETEPVIEYPASLPNKNDLGTEGLFLREYGVIDEHYTRHLISREELFNVELGAFCAYDEYEYQYLTFYNNSLTDTLSQFLDADIFLMNGQYSFIVDNPAETGIIHLGNINQPTVALSRVLENGTVISMGSAGYLVENLPNRQFTNNCVDYITGNELALVGADDETVSPTEISLSANYPNPFHPAGTRSGRASATTFKFNMPEKGFAELSVYNLKGQKVKSLTENTFTKGEHEVIWNGDDDQGQVVSSGIYLYRLRVNNKAVATKKCLLLK